MSLDIFSRYFFKKYLIEPCLSLSKDKTPIVKNKFCSIAHNIKLKLHQQKEDTDHLFTLVERINDLKDDIDLDVASAAEEAEFLLVYKQNPQALKREQEVDAFRVKFE